MDYTIPAGLAAFGCDVFTDDVLRERVRPEVYEALHRTIEEGTELTYEVADAVAQAMKEWALSKGATHYTHWFQPMTGSTAEKHDSFLELEGVNGASIMSFSGKALIKGEADGSSFPTGGLRATFEARGYTTWDCTSPAFVRQDSDGCTLCIPTAFCSFSGEALDEKTPLLRSMEAISHQAVRVLKCLGVQDVKRVTPTVGGEQEYFLVDKDHFLKRKDLVYAGRTLFGAQPAKGQELADQYYAATPERVLKFMHELNESLWRLGVPAKTQHNEAAPAQYELAPLFASANVATDHNQIIMEQMRRIANHHGFTCLLHEKPFAGLTGSGKHDNWSLSTDTGRNLLKYGKGTDERIFWTFFIAVIAAVDRYAPVLRMACATLGNEQRLGGHEAPPQIISVFTGSALHKALRQQVQGKGGSMAEKEHMSIGVSTLPILHKDDTDRNRTSPFAFTGNKFEFRMVGASQSLGMPNTVLNTIVADSLMEIADVLEKAEDKDSAWLELMAKLVEEHDRVIFNGNNYAHAWEVEAEKRGLPNIKTTVEAIGVMGDPEVQGVFARQNVLGEGELIARRDIAWGNYAQMAKIEAFAMLKIARQKLLPASIRYSGVVAKAVNQVREAGAPVKAQKRVLDDLCLRVERLDDAIQALAEALEEAMAIQGENYERAKVMQDTIHPLMDTLRDAADDLERVVDKKCWPLPSYGEMIFHVVK